MPISAMSHFTILTADVEATRHFYCDVLGFVNGPRPPFSFAGLWLYVDDKPILHVIGDRKPHEIRTGVIDHMAFDATGLAQITKRLKNAGVDFQLGRVAGQKNGPWQLFCYDPNQAKVEIDFAGDEKMPAGS